MKKFFVFFALLMFLAMPALAQSNREVTQAMQQASSASLKGKKCEAYQLYKKALDLGIEDKDGYKVAQDFVQNYQEQCKNAVIDKESNNKKVQNIDNNAQRLCHQGMKARDMEDHCAAYYFYSQAKKEGYPVKGRCKDTAELILKLYAKDCKGKKPDNLSDYIQGCDLSPDLIYSTAKEYEAKNKLRLACNNYKKLEKCGYPNKEAEEDAKEFMANYEDECKPVSKKDGAVVLPF